MPQRHLLRSVRGLLIASFFVSVAFVSQIVIAQPAHALTMAERVYGRILLQTQQHGEGWYVDPVTKQRTFLGRPADAFRVMREFGLGITNANLAKIPVYTETRAGDVVFVNRLKGRILLQVEAHGEAWYVSPVNGKRYFLGRPADAFALMRNLGLGITDANLTLIPVHPNSAPLPLNSVKTCSTLPAATGDVIYVNFLGQLERAADELKAGRSNVTVIVRPGTYTLSNSIWVAGTNVTVRGSTGNRDDVRIFGQGGAQFQSPTNVFQAAADGFTVADMTIGRVGTHAVQVHGEEPFDADNFKMHNVRVIDTGQQMLKGSYNASGSSSSDNGIVECSLFEYTSGYGPQYYIGGIDVHRGKNWIVRNNTFRNIRSPEETLAEHAIHFWSDAAGTLVENNTILNSDRGIGFGLSDRGHTGGVIRNNKIYHDASRGDVGIALENAPGVTVERNTILFANTYANAIEYRFAGTYGGTIKNNVTNKAITSREGGTAILSGNKTNARISDYVDPASGDFTKK